MEKRQKQTREAARIASLTKKVEKLKEYNEGYQQLLRCMDAILYEVGIKYGERHIGSEGTPGVWVMEIPVPDPSKIDPAQVRSAKDGDGYKITVRSIEFVFGERTRKKILGE